jgi:HEAT repeat protein
MKTLIAVALTLVILTPSVHGQDQQELDRLLAKLNDSKIEDSTIFALLKHRDQRVIAALQNAFKNHEDKQTRQYIASSLIHLGDKSEKYSRYLEGFAKDAIESDAPDMFVYGRDGMPVQGQWSAEFYAWSAKHGLDIESAGKQAFVMYPRDILLFSEAEGPRSVELLRKGLQSLNPMVVFASAQALTGMNDVGSLPLILQRINTSKAVLAEPLTDRVATFSGDIVERKIAEAITEPKLKERYRVLVEAKHKQPSSATH